MMKDPYRELVERHKQPLEKVQATVETDGQPLTRPVKNQEEKKRHYPLLTCLLVFFIASPFLAMFLFKEEKPAINQVVTEQPDVAEDEAAQDAQ